MISLSEVKEVTRLSVFVESNILASSIKEDIWNYLKRMQVQASLADVYRQQNQSRHHDFSHV